MSRICARDRAGLGRLRRAGSGVEGVPSAAGPSVDANLDDLVYQSALDDFLTFGENVGAFVSVRILSGTDPDGNTHLTAARALTQTGTGVSFDLRCAPQVDSGEYQYTVVAGVNVVLS
ncbi:hypothetical protein B7R54_02980 [Subtercola boreus]|uniref:Uncharacterized protein n=1 Tax=Subtercola boreus TaxID=120213 RepID=A0A3E0VEG4_9MICO|nr:hypothetical protein [Subtercola boreus]RFA08302.1 hypothetical protein B7R54_02980 [Subtercola boreus]TQL54798.1 hypothetical protein FB464_2344 [Subtercola boreus]